MTCKRITFGRTKWNEIDNQPSRNDWPKGERFSYPADWPRTIECDRLILESPARISASTSVVLGIADARLRRGGCRYVPISTNSYFEIRLPLDPGN